jgi:hypothetical protein
MLLTCHAHLLFFCSFKYLAESGKMLGDIDLG